MQFCKMEFHLINYQSSAISAFWSKKSLKKSIHVSRKEVGGNGKFCAEKVVLKKLMKFVEICTILWLSITNKQWNVNFIDFLSAIFCDQNAPLSPFLIQFTSTKCILIKFYYLPLTLATFTIFYQVLLLFTGIHQFLLAWTNF